MRVKPLQAHRIHLRLQTGFTLAELAIVMVVVALLLGGMMAMVTAQSEQRKWGDTQSQLEAARDALLGYAIANGRLPCPANSTSNGLEVRQSGAAAYPYSCGAENNNPAANQHDYYGGVVSGVTYGLLPAATLGYQPVDSQGFALDAWGNRIRYALSATFSASEPTTTNFTNASTLKTSGVSFQPDDLVVCNVSPATVTNTVCDANTSVTNLNTVVAIVFSTGKNGATGGTGTNEARNLDSNALFVSRTPDPETATGGEFDDQMLWISVGTLYSKLIAAGLLP
jgi:prepilin-type N-terminal cleavage/methylation domain-containing protein